MTFTPLSQTLNRGAPLSDALPPSSQQVSKAVNLTVTSKDPEKVASLSRQQEDAREPFERRPGSQDAQEPSSAASLSSSPVPLQVLIMRCSLPYMSCLFCSFVYVVFVGILCVFYCVIEALVFNDPTCSLNSSLCVVCCLFFVLFLISTLRVWFIS